MSETTDLGYGRRGHALSLVVPAVTGAVLILGLWALLSRRARTLKTGASAAAKDRQGWRGADRSVEP